MSDTIHFSTKDWELNEASKNKQDEATVVRAKAILQEIGELLEQKNKAYGDSALSPIRIFSKLKSSDSIRVRIDDKLSRISNVGITDETEDSVRDLLGYLVLLLVAIERGE